MFLTLLSFPRTSAAVPVVAVRDVALPPAVAPGVVTLTVPPAKGTYAAVPPAVYGTVSLAVPVSTIRMVGLAPSVTATTSLTPAVAVTRYAGVAPTVSGSVSLTPIPAVVKLAAVAPGVQYTIVAGGAIMQYVVIAPSVTGGSSGGLGVLPKKSGD